MKPWVAWPKISGESSRQAHADMPKGTFEREMGKEGFFGPATHLYHKKPPTSWESIDGPLQPRAFNIEPFCSGSPSPWDATLLFHNTATRFRVWQMNASMDHLVRNADGDDLLFLHRGEAELYCDFGHLSLSEGDYLMIPRGVMWRLELTEASTPVTLLMIEATGDSFTLPEKGILGEHAIFDPAMLDTPEINPAFLKQQSDDRWELRIKRNNQVTKVQYAHNPLDAVGWHGTLLPMRINWRDIRPITSHRYHIPPSIHATFVTSRLMVTTFCPRPIESDPGALKLPFYHNNDDYDEVLFYHHGQFLSRDTIGPGMVTYHPCGLTHGPHPKAYAKAAKAERDFTNEVAVMLDTRDPLEVADLPAGAELPNYLDSWKEN